MSFLCSQNLAQSWNFINEGESNCKNIRTIQAASDNVIVAAGGDNNAGFILRSNDGGSSWEEIPTPDNRIIYDLYFFDENIGIATGQYVILRTTDGGASWEEQLNEPHYFLDVDFHDNLEGYAVTSSGLLYKTEDGGLNWNSVPQALPGNFFRIENTGPNTIHLILQQTSSTGNLYLTCSSIDGGQTWGICTQIFNSVNSLHFPTANDGYGVGDFGRLIITHDAGLNWDTTSITGLPVNNHLAAVHFKNASTGYIAAWEGTILKTEDSGQTWTAMYQTQGAKLLALSAEDTDRIFAAGTNGMLIRSQNAGIDWGICPTGTIGFCDEFQDIFGIDENKVMVCGRRGAAYLSQDGGASWLNTNIPSIYQNSTFYATHFVDNNVGFLGGTPLIMKTEDGGFNWYPSAISGPAGTVYDIHFSEGNTTVGYAVQEGGGVLKTTNGGTSWFALDSITNVCLQGVHFITPDKGWIVGDAGFIGYTEDGGQNWQVDYVEVAPDTYPTFADVFFVNDNFGIIGGHGISLSTTDGGISWDTFWAGDELLSIHFTNSQNGWAAGWGNGAGFLRRTFDGGNTWVDEYPDNLPRRSLRAVHFPTEYKGFAAGSQTILETDRRIGFCFEDTSGASGTIISIPVTVQNFDNISSFQMTIASLDANVAKIVEVDGLTVGGDFIKIVDDEEARILWSCTGECISIADSTILFYVQIQLVGIPGTCTYLVLNDTPVPPVAFQCVGDYQVPLVVFPKGAEICIDEYTNLSGKIEKVTGGGKQDVEVTAWVLPNPGGAAPTAITNDLGEYFIPDLLPGSDLSIEPVYDVNWGLNITSNDYNALNSIWDGTTDFTTWWQKISADVNNDGFISKADIDDLAFIILDPTEPIPNNTSWRFVPKADAPLPLTPDFDVPVFSEIIEHQDISGDLEDQDFWTIKVGDLDGDANLKTSETDDRNTKGTLELIVEKTELTKNGTWQLDFYSPDFQDISSGQLAFSFDASTLEFEEIQSGLLEKEAIQFSRNQLANGQLPMMWSSTQTLSADAETILFSLVFTKKTGLANAEIWLSQSTIPALAFQNSQEALEIQLSEKSHTENLVKLYPCQPNPWSEETHIQFDIPENVEEAYLNVVNVAGIVVRRIPLARGMNQSYVLKRNDLVSGYYLIALEVDGIFMEQGRMLVK